MKPLREAYREDEDVRLRNRIGLQIRTLRQVKHLSQSELARRIGVRPGPLNALEKGRHVPSGRLLMRLADELETTVDVLLARGQTSGSAVREERSIYLTGTPASGHPSAQPILLRDDLPLNPAVERRLAEIIREFLDLEDICGAQKCASIPLRHPFTADDRGIEVLAQQVRQFLGIGYAVIFDYLELFENAGLRVVFCKLPEDRASAAYYDAVNSNAFFFINEKVGVERQVFELAKRLGSIYIHNGGANIPDTLRIARKFAAFFLMPEAAVRATVAQTGLTPDRWTYPLVLRLKHRFGVSAESFVIRLEELDLITGALAKKIKTRIRREYKKTGYKEPDGSRRILSPNGRLEDLRAVARELR